MARIIAIDFGMRRVGIASTDPLQIIASPLTTVSNKEAVDYIHDFCNKEEVETIVVDSRLECLGNCQTWSQRY